MALDPSLYADLVGTPYQEQGRTPGVGLDCLGVALIVTQRRGFPVPDPEIPTSEQTLATLQRVYHTHWSRADRPFPPGSVLAWRTFFSEVHLGVIISPTEVIHALQYVGTIISSWPSSSRIIVAYVPSDDVALRHSQSSQEIVLGPGTYSGPSAAHVSAVGDILSPLWRQDWDVAPGTMLEELIPPEWRDDPARIRIVVGDSPTPVPEEDWPSTAVKMGDHVTVSRLPGFGAALFTALGATAGGALLTSAGTLKIFGTILAAGLNAALTWGISALLASRPDNAQENVQGSPTYQVGSGSNTMLPGDPIPVAYGEKMLVPRLLQVFKRINEEGESVLHMLMVCSQGEVHQVIRDVDGDVDGLEVHNLPDPSDVLINDNPADGYNRVRVSTRVGKDDQDSIDGFQDSVTNITYEVTVDDGEANAFTHTTTRKVEAFELNLFFPTGLVNFDDEGDPGPRSVEYRVDWRRPGETTWQTSGSQVVNGSSGADFSVAFRKDGLDLDVYEIKLVRIQPTLPEDDADKFSEFQLTDVLEITHDDQSHPGLALLAVVAVATDQLSGAVPGIKVRGRWRLLWIWDGLDEVDPTFVRAYSANAAWVSYDVLTNRRWGGGTFFSATDPQLTTFQLGAAFMDELVPDGQGGTHKRGEVSLVLEATTDLWAAAQSALAPFRATLVNSGRRIRLKVEKEEVPRQLFTMGNIIAGTYRGEYSNPREARNIVEAQFWNEELDGERDTAPQVDFAAQAEGHPPNKLTYSLPAVGNKARAATSARWKLNVETRRPKRITFQAFMDALAVEAGDLFYFRHAVPRPGPSGRIRSATATTVVVDDRVSVNDPVGPNPTLIIVRRVKDGALETITRLITGPIGPQPPGTTLTLFGTDWDGGSIPDPGQVYSAGTLVNITETYRLVSIQAAQGLRAKLTAVSYDPSDYDDDPGTVEPSTTKAPNPNRLPAAPTGLRVSERYRRTPDGHYRPVLECFFQPDEEGLVHDVYIEEAGVTEEEEVGPK